MRALNPPEKASLFSLFLNYYWDPARDWTLSAQRITRTAALTALVDFMEARPSRYVICYTLFYWAALAVGWVFAFHQGYQDYIDYLAMARDQGHVPEPFASRIAAPFIAGLVADVTGVTARNALAGVSLITWALCALPAASLLRRAGVSLPWALVFATIPFPALAVGYYLVPDGMAALLVLISFWAISTNAPVLSGASAALAILSRNSISVAIALWSAYCALSRSTRVAALAALGGTVVGIILLRTVFSPEAANVHEMNGALYLLLKPGVNAVKNLLGLELYLNTVDWCAPPRAVFDISFIPGLGDISQIGYCSINPMRPLYSLLSYLMIFGVAPILAVLAMIRAGRAVEPRSIIGIVQALAVFAPFIILFLLSPTLGITIKRLFVTAYPLLFPIAGLITSAVPGQARLMPLWLIGYNIVGFALLATIRP